LLALLKVKTRYGTVQQDGFSLVELIVSIAVLSILISVAIPSFNSSILRVRASSSADTLITSINYARSEAITRNQRIVLCASDDGLNCLAPQGWNDGWIVMIQADGAVLRYKEISTPGASITLTDAANTNFAAMRVVFTSSGETHLENAAGAETVQPYLFFVQVNGCNAPQLNIRRQISIAISGLMTVNPRLPC